MLSKVVKAVEATAAATTARGAPGGRHVKRRKTSAASFFADTDDSSEDDGDAIVDAANPEDELKAYLNVPQIKYVTEQDMMNWWKDHQGEFPNVAVMVTTYPVIRLFYGTLITNSHNSPPFSSSGPPKVPTLTCMSVLKGAGLSSPRNAAFMTISDISEHACGTV